MNTILIVSDTFRRDHLGCYGNNWIRTPHLNKFAEESVVFDNAYAGSFPTVPNRADVFTGRYTFPFYGWGELPRNEVVVAQLLNQSGYMTMCIFDNVNFSRRGYYFERGFQGFIWIRGNENDDYMTDPMDVKLPCSPHKLRNGERTIKKYLRNVSTRRHESDYFAAKTMITASQWLERNYRQENFFLYVDTFDPHEPWDPPKWYVDLYDPGYQGEEVIYPAYGTCDYLSEAELKHVKALYAAKVVMVDKWIGFFLERLEDLGIYDDTAVIFTTDHGIYLGEHGYIGKSGIPGNRQLPGPLYQELIHIPLIVHLPGIKSNRINSIVQPPDLMPTILELASAKDPGTMHGKSLVPLIKGEAKSIRNFAISSHPFVNPLAWSTITTERWSLLFRGPEPSNKKFLKTGEMRPELYDLSSDPKQTDNVFVDHLDVATELQSKYIEYLKSIGAPEEHLKAREDLQKIT